MQGASLPELPAGNVSASRAGYVLRSTLP